MFIPPWNKDAERVLKQLSNYGRGFSINNPKLPREFGMKYPELIRSNMLDIATTRNKRERKTWFIVPPDVMVKPLYKKGKFGFQFNRYKIL